MIQEDYCSFETSMILREKGFNECSHMQYNTFGDIGDYNITDRSRYPERYIYAPTLQMAVKWIEKVHHILVVPDYIYECTPESWCYKIYRLGANGKPERCVVKGVRYDKEKEDMVEEIVGYRDYDRSYEYYERREEAVEEGIRYVLKKLI